jgi:hypothetical protein
MDFLLLILFGIRSEASTTNMLNRHLISHLNLNITILGIALWLIYPGLYKAEDRSFYYLINPLH